jgi:hypothetical protein
MQEKSITAVTYMTIYQMRKLGVVAGELKTVKMSTIQNFEAILKLETLRRKGVSLDVAVLQTHSVEYADTSIVQSGHQIIGAKVITTNKAYFDPVGDLMREYEYSNKSLISVHDALLAKYGLARNDKMWINYDIELELSPLKLGDVARPLGGTP